MVLGVQLYGPLAKGDMDEMKLLETMKKLGVRRIEPCIAFGEGVTNPSFWSAERFRELSPVIRDKGLEVISCHIRSDHLLQDIPKLQSLAKDCGIRHFVVGMPVELTEVAIQEAAFAYRMVADELEAYGARVLVHNGRKDVETKIAGVSAYEYLIQIGLGKLGMQLDCGWAAAGGADLREFLQANASQIESFHFKDFAVPGKSEKDCVIGKGGIDSLLCMQFCRAKGIPVFVDQDAYASVAEDLRESCSFLMDAGAQREHTVSYLNIYDTETKQIRILRRFDGVVEAPNWVESQKALVYNREGGIYRFDLDTNEAIRIDSGIANHCNNDHVISFDEKQIAVSSDFETREGGGSRIFILPLEGGEARLVTPKAPSYLHGWSPDGKELAYCAFRTVDEKNAVDIYTIPADGGEEKRLTTEGFNDGPEYSPDGKHIWFISTRTGLMQVYCMNTDGSDVRQMTFENQNNWFGHVSPDGRKVVNLSYREGDLLPEEHLPNMQVELWMMDYDGSNRERLFGFFGGQGSMNVNSWSGDSRYFAFVSYDIQV